MRKPSGSRNHVATGRVVPERDAIHGHFEQDEQAVNQDCCLEHSVPLNELSISYVNQTNLDIVMFAMAHMHINI